MNNRFYNQGRRGENYGDRPDERRGRTSPYDSEWRDQEDFYRSGQNRFSAGEDTFQGDDFGRGYSGDYYPETFGGHGIYEGYETGHGRGYGHHGGRTSRENLYQNRGRNYESGADRGGYRGEYNRGYADRSSNWGQGSINRGDYYRGRGRLESERGYTQGRGGDGEDRNWWDKTVDEVSSWMGDEEAARRREMDATRYGNYRGRGPKNYTRSDERIKEDVSDRLTDYAYLDASDIEVEVKDGEVFLIGTVLSRYAKRMAEDVAEDCSGVRNVENRLRVEPKTSMNASDSTAGRSSDTSGTTENMAFSKKA